MKKLITDIHDIQRLHHTGQLEEAKAGYLQLLKDHPEEVHALHGLSLIFAEEGDLDAAQTYLEKAIALCPQDPALKLNLANILKEKQLPEAAEQVLKNLIAEFPHYSNALNNLGILYYQQQRWSEAIACYQDAITQQPTFLDAYYNLGLALSKAGQTALAIEAYQALLELAPEHAAAKFQLACLLLQMQQTKTALTHFLHIAAEHPHHFETQVNLATCYLKDGLLVQAKTHYLKANELMPHDTQVIFNLGVIAMQLGKISEASLYYQQMLKLDPNSFAGHYSLGNAFLAMRDIPAALLHFREALRIAPENASVRHMIAFLSQEKPVTNSVPEYIRALFDSYADHYEPHLTQGLNYQVPVLLEQAITASQGLRETNWDIADLGCGTGLCGMLLRQRARSLIGVDLSPNMLALAATKKIYDELVESDVLAFLADKREQFDLIVAGDVVVYFGDLAELFALVGKSLKQGGLFAFNAEIESEENYSVMITGRFAHQQAYLDQLAGKNGMSITYYQVATLRYEQKQPVSGHLYILRKA